MRESKLACLLKRKLHTAFLNSYLPWVTCTVPGISEFIINGTACFTEQVQVLQHLLFRYPMPSRIQSGAVGLYSAIYNL